MRYFSEMIKSSDSGLKLPFRQAQNERKEIKANKANEEKPKQREKKRLRRRVVALNQASSAITAR